MIQKEKDAVTLQKSAKFNVSTKNKHITSTSQKVVDDEEAGDSDDPFELK